MPTEVTRVSVGRESPTAKDVLDYAAALIRAFGWNNIATSGQTSSEASGFTLHDAVGESCTRLSRATDPARSGGSKDWVVSNVEGRERNLRQGAISAIHAAIAETGFAVDPANSNASDVQFNDQAKDASEVLAILEAAAGKVTE